MNRYILKIALSLSFLFFLGCVASYTFAHISIPTSPTTACGSIDSTDLVIHTGNQIDSLIGVADPFSTSKKLYTTEGDSTTMTGATTTAWVRNPDVWTGSLDFTGVNAWTQMYNGYSNRYQHKATLISPRHFVTAHHWGVAPGSTLAFISATNETVYRTVSNTIQVGTTDIEVGVLDSDVPDSVTYYPIVASSTLDSMVYKFVPPQTLDIPIVAFNQFEEAFLLRMTGLDANGIGFSRYFDSGNRASFSKYAVPGDSGSPLFMIIDNRPVLLTTFTSANGGANLGAYISQINSTITSLGNSNGYTVTGYNPSCFTQYTPNHIPVFTNSTATTTRVHYGSATDIFTFSATDADSDTLTYSLESLSSVSSSTLLLTASDYFSINSGSGQVSQIADLSNIVLGDKIALVAKVVDNRSPQATAYATTTITIDHPVVTSASRKNSVIEVAYDRALATTSVPLASDFVVKVNGTNRSVSGVAVTGRSVQLTLSSAVSSGDSITLAYTPGTNKIKDTLGSFAPQIFATSPLQVSNSRAGEVDTSFDPGTGFNNTAASVTVDPSGKIYVGGFFTQYNGTTANRIIKLNADGSVDSSFNTGTAFGAGVGVNVSKILLQADGKILAFGLFSSYKGTAVTDIVRLNTDGSLDTTFNSGGAGLVGSYIQDADIQSDGKIVIVGSFSQYNGTTRYGVARLNSNGTLDTTFVPATNSSDLNIRAVDIQSDGKVLIAGSFTAVGGVSRNLVARLTTTGSLDSAFVPSSTVNDYIADTYTVKQLSNGNVLVGGLMSYVNSSWSMVLFDSSATALNYFNNPLTTETDGIMDTYEQLDGKILVAGGAFVYGSYVYKDLVRLDASGVLDETFGHTETGGISFSNVDYGIAINSSGDIYVVGTFTNHAGVTRSGIVKLFGSTEADVTPPTVSGVTSSQSNGRVGQGVTIPIQVEFSENVTVTGSPTLALSVSTTTRVATYSSGSGSSVLTFDYTIQDGDLTSDLEYTNSTALSLAGGAITDASANDAVLTLPVPGATGSLGYNKSIAVDGTLPVLFALSVDGSAITLIYNEDLNPTLPDTADFTVVKNGTTSLAVTSVNISSTTVTLNLNNSLVPTDTLTLAYTPVTNPLQDLYSNQVAGFSATSVLNTTLDSSGPAISSVATSDITTSGVTIIWNTDESSDTQVEYGLTSTYTASSTYSATLSTGHSVTLSGLSSGTTYHFRVVSADTFGNKTYGSDNTFTTANVSSGGGGGGGGGSSGSKSAPVTPAVVPGSATSTTATTEGSGSLAYILSTQKPRNLTVGSVGNDVFILQKFLNSIGFTIAQTGLGSAGHESTYFGLKTKNALARYQKSVGIVPATGYFGPKTRAYILKTLGKEVSAQIETTTSTSAPANLCTTNLYLTSPVKYGTKNNPEDVKLLESFLNTYEGNTLPINGVYELADYKAVIAFQEKYAQSILAPWKLTKGTGYVYTASLSKIKEIVEAECKK